MQTINPFLWFNTNAEEAVTYYTSIFKNSKILSRAYYEEGTPMPKGTLMVATFELQGQTFHALNGGPVYSFSPATSFLVNCDTQEEVDHLWEKLSDGGTIMECGWLTDKFGVTWQIVPTMFMKLMNDPDPIKRGRVMQAMLKMIKLDIAELQKAYDGDE